MKKKQFWRFDFKTDSDIDVSIKSSRIISSKEITAKSKNVPGKVIKSKIRKEDGILLANFNHFAKTGEVKAIGLVIDIDPETQEPVVSWKKKTFSLHPNPSGGIKQCKNEV